jgi:hypothetical protein
VTAGPAAAPIAAAIPVTSALSRADNASYSTGSTTSTPNFSGSSLGIMSTTRRFDSPSPV